jgi:hypothetical protein
MSVKARHVIFEVLPPIVTINGRKFICLHTVQKKEREKQKKSIKRYFTV